MAANALSMVTSWAELCALVFFTVSNSLLQQIQESWADDEEIQVILANLQSHSIEISNTHGLMVN